MLLQNDRRDRFQSCIVSVVVHCVALWTHGRIDIFYRIWISKRLISVGDPVLCLYIVYVPAVTEFGPITAILGLI